MKNTVRSQEISRRSRLTPKEVRRSMGKLCKDAASARAFFERVGLKVNAKGDLIVRPL